MERKIDIYLKSNYVKAMTGKADINSQLTLDQRRAKWDRRTMGDIE